MEEYTLTEPEVKPEIVNTKYQITLMSYDWLNSTIIYNLRGDNGEMISTGYGGPMASEEEKKQAKDFMRYLNTANFSTNSMQKRILQKLSNDGKLPAGTVTGTPDPVTP